MNFLKLLTSNAHNFFYTQDITEILREDSYTLFKYFHEINMLNNHQIFKIIRNLSLLLEKEGIALQDFIFKNNSLEKVRKCKKMAWSLF